MDELLMSVYTINVCGFPFVPGAEGRVLLLRKEDDVGNAYYDGFGGPITHDPTEEMAAQQSVAEYVAEETGILTKPVDWTEIVTLRGEDWEIAFFFTIQEAFREARSRHNEAVSAERPIDLPLNTLPALRWLIPLVLDDGVVKPLGMSGIQL